MKKTNVLFIIWGFIVLGIMVCLTILGFMLKRMNSNYRKLENDLKEIAITYVEDKSLYPEGSEEIKVTRNELRENNYLEELKLDKDTCDGYVIIRLEEGFKYIPFIKCGKYTTKGY